MPMTLPRRSAFLLLVLAAAVPAHADFKALETLARGGARVSASIVDLETGRTLESMGVNADQARAITERLSAPAAATPASRQQQAEEAASTVGTATGWLSATVLLSLVLSMIGGALGSRGSRRVNRRVEHRDTVTVADTGHGISRAA